MKYVINFPNNPFDEEAYIRLIRRELHSMAAENARLRREIEELKKNRDISSAFGLAYQERTVRPTFVIDKVIFNPPATIVFWKDGTKTVVKCADFDIWDPEKGLAMAICKRVYGEAFHKIFKDFTPEEDEESEYPNIPLYNWFNDVAEAARTMANAFSMNKEDK